MLSTAQIAKLASDAGQLGQKGAAQYHLLSNRNPMGGSRISIAQERFLKDVLAAAPDAPSGVKYNHPANTAMPSARNEPLTAAQVAWLTRLSSDPSQVSHADAVEVFRLLGGARGDQHRGDIPLLRSIAEPIREYHDRNAANADLQRLSASPLAPIPSSALAAMADAVAAENPHLQPQEAIGRASAAISEIGQKRVNDRARAEQDARQRVEGVDAKTADRMAVTR